MGIPQSVQWACRAELTHGLGLFRIARRWSGHLTHAFFRTYKVPGASGIDVVATIRFYQSVRWCLEEFRHNPASGMYAELSLATTDATTSKPMLYLRYDVKVWMDRVSVNAANHTGRQGCPHWSWQSSCLGLRPTRNRHCEGISVSSVHPQLSPH